MGKGDRPSLFRNLEKYDKGYKKLKENSAPPSEENVKEVKKTATKIIYKY